MRRLYPEIKPYITHSLAVEPPHLLYVEECGIPDGIPVLFVHGGPGAGCETFHRRFFDPEKYRIILFDQRGSGKSSPHATLENNTSQALVADMEYVRAHLGVDKWLLFGGSWGATLSLLYAQAHPERVAGMVLRGIFLGSDKELHWFYQEGASSVFPDFWQDFIRPIATQERKDILSAYYRRLTGNDEIARMAAAKAWSIWEGRCATLRPVEEVVNHFGNPHTALSLARIESHFFLNKCFLEPNQILNNMDKLADIPAYIVHGRYDMICPVEQAWHLHQAWPGAELRIIADAGHAASEPATTDALVRIMDALARQR